MAVDEEKASHTPSSRGSVVGDGDTEHSEGSTSHDHHDHPPADHLVRWEEGDPLDPHNWSVAYKCWVTALLSSLALAGSLGSSITSPADKVIGEYVGVSEEAAVLDISLYIIGFAAGPILWAPISEVWGRRVSILPAVFCLGLFSIGTAASRNAAGVFLTRFLAGFFGSAPVSNVTAALGDLWVAESRGTAISIYAIAVNGGPSIGPVIGAAILLNPRLGWRWTEWIEAIWVFATFALCFFCLPELYPSVLLARKARALRRDTGDARYYHPHEHLELDLASIVTKQLSRPLRMLCTELIVTCIAFYAAFVYGVLYLSLELFPIVFQDIRGYDPLVGSLPFLALLLGITLSLTINVGNQPRYRRASRAAHGRPVPEARLPPMAAGAVLLVAGLFMFAWTATPSHHWSLPCVAAVLVGAGFNSIFQQCLNFLIDVYGVYAASSTAAVTFLRSAMAAGLPLAARPMYAAMGIGPAVSVLGAVAAALLPVPFLFMRYGPALRERSKLTPKE